MEGHIVCVCALLGNKYQTRLLTSENCVHKTQPIVFVIKSNARENVSFLISMSVHDLESQQNADNLHVQRVVTPCLLLSSWDSSQTDILASGGRVGWLVGVAICPLQGMIMKPALHPPPQPPGLQGIL